MTPWKRLWGLAAFVAIFIYLGAEATNPRVMLLVAFCSNVFAAPFGQILITWIETGFFRHPPTESLSATVDAAVLPGPAQSDAATALVVAGISVYALLFTSLALATQLASLDRLESAKMLVFTDTGYIEAQKYLVGSLFFVIVAPAVTAACVALAGSNRRLSFRSFCAGVAISLPVYFLAARFVGLPVGIGDVTQPSTALGGQFPSVPGYHGFEITARLIQYAMLLAFGLGLTGYAWAVANLSKAVIGLIRRISR
jgi:hypothetical protein